MCLWGLDNGAAMFTWKRVPPLPLLSVPSSKYGARGHANIYVDGTLNMTTPGGNLNFDNGTGADNHYWHIGLDGMINLSNTTTITKNAKHGMWR